MFRVEHWRFSLPFSSWVPNHVRCPFLFLCILGVSESACKSILRTSLHGGGNIIILFIRGDQGGLQWAHMGRTPTTIIVNVLPPARHWLCWFRKCVMLSSTAWMCRVDISLCGVLNIKWRIRKCWRSSDRGSWSMFRGNLPRCHLMAVSRRVGLFWPIIVAKGHFSGVNGAGFRLRPCSMVTCWVVLVSTACDVKDTPDWIGLQLCGISGSICGEEQSRNTVDTIICILWGKECQ